MAAPIPHGITKVKVGNFRWTMWYGLANRSGNDVNKMAAPFCTSARLVLCKLFEGIWNNYIDIEQKIMQFRFIISFCTLLSHFSRRSDLAARRLKENTSKYKLIQTTLDGERARRTKGSQILLILCFSTLTNYWKHFLTLQNNFTSSSTIWKWRKRMQEVYTGQLHLVIVSIDIISTSMLLLWI